MSGKVYLVGAGPGAPDLMTLRAHRALMSADVVLYDALIDASMVEGIDAEVIYVGKRCGKHVYTQEAINAMLCQHGLAGKTVVRLKGGDPTVLGRGVEEAAALIEAGVEHEIVPGVTSCIAGPALAGIPVTHRGIADSFHVATAHKRHDDTHFSIPAYSPSTTVVLLMGVGTMATWRQQLLNQNYPADLPVAFVQQAATPSQRRVLTTLSRCVDDASASEIRPPSIAIIGWVVQLAEKIGPVPA